jgi:pyruvate dehydrogenase E1 component alpha subunit
MDVEAVAAASQRAAAAVRGGSGPAFLELRTYRFRAHSMYDPELYRDKVEVEQWKQHDPIANLLKSAAAAGEPLDPDVDGFEAEIAAVIDDAVAYAEAGNAEPVEELTRFVYSEATPCV